MRFVEVHPDENGEFYRVTIVGMMDMMEKSRRREDRKAEIAQERSKRQNALLGPAIRAARLGRKWNLRDLAEHSEVSARYIGKIELGDNIPSERVIKALAGALDLPVPQMIEYAERQRASQNAGPPRTRTTDPHHYHRHPLVTEYGHDRLHQDEKILDTLYDRAQANDSRLFYASMDMDQYETLGELKRFYLLMLSSHLLNIRPQVPGAEGQQTMMRALAERIRRVNTFALDTSSSWMTAFSITEFAAIAALAGSRERLAGALRTHPEWFRVRDRTPEGLDWQVLFLMPSAWAAILSAGPGEKLDGPLRRLTAAIRNIPRWERNYREVRAVSHVGRPEERLEVHKQWLKITADAMKLISSGADPERRQRVERRFDQLIALAATIEDYRVLNTLLQLQSALRVACGYTPFDESMAQNPYRGTLKDLLR